MYWKNLQLVIFGFIILFLSFFLYFRNYSYPPSLFWDENYHIASAEKYLRGVFFMEPHPPLGKLFIALGEYIINPNKNIDKREFLTTDYIHEIPGGYSFAGVRFFPTFFATLGSIIFFLILYTISGRELLSFLFTFLYLFDNALIVHNRGAMLEGTQIFFILLLLLYFVRQLHTGNRKHIPIERYAVLGLLYGLVISIKYNGLIFGFLCFFLIFFEMYFGKIHLRKKEVVKHILNIFSKLFAFFAIAALVFVGIYYLHFVIASNPFGDRYYEASDGYRKIINEKKTADLRYVFLQLKEQFSYFIQYQKGVPAYDVCKPDENGSLPVMWPFGGKTINYRWETADGKTRYLYLLGNPVIWGLGGLGVLSSFILIGAFFLFKLPITNRRVFFLICVFMTMYIAYMLLMMGLSRVMYLYHYFIPLIISFVLWFLMYIYMFEKDIDKKNGIIYLVTIIFVLLFVVVFFFFSPLTYYKPLTGEEFKLRNWFFWWGLKSI